MFAHGNDIEIFFEIEKEHISYILDNFECRSVLKNMKMNKSYICQFSIFNL